MTEREKIVKIIQSVDLYDSLLYRYCIDMATANKLADALIAARVRDITERGWIFMNGEAIVPTPEIYNKVAELLSCPKIEDGMNND